MLPAIYSRDKSEKAKAQRQAVNTTVQGSAADLVKTAMINIAKEMHIRWGAWWCQENVDARRVPHLVLQIHDELLFDVPREHLTEVAHLVKECCSNAIPLSVPTPVSLRIGDNWGALKPYPS
jgi:DNA polymerase theta